MAASLAPAVTVALTTPPPAILPPPEACLSQNTYPMQVAAALLPGVTLAPFADAAGENDLARTPFLSPQVNSWYKF